MNKFLSLINNIREYQLCANHLSLKTPDLHHKQILSITYLLAGQAPDIRVHNSGIPWNNPISITP